MAPSASCLAPAACGPARKVAKNSVPLTSALAGINLVLRKGS